MDRFAGIDRANAERLKRGRRPIEARLDLHGMTQAEAHRELMAFVRIAGESGKRCVLVITGRGLGPEGSGVLKRAVPRWLAEVGLRHWILAIAPAQPRHGGAGALYLLLRRRR
jgi:DNA-nicking Smr family endonuclease